MEENNGTATLSRKEREKKIREREILLAARTLFAERGFHNTTLDEIAHKAEFAKGTIYNYFANKDELFIGIIENIFDELHTLTTEAMSIEGAGAREKMIEYAKAIITHSKEHSDLFRLMMQEAPRQGLNSFSDKVNHFHEREQESREIVAKTLAEEIAKGTVINRDPNALAFLFDGMLRYYCMHSVKQLTPAKSLGIEHAAELMVTVFFDGITHS